MSKPMRLLRPALVLAILLTLLLGVVYPLAITAIGALAFPSQASGSLLYEGTTVVGSKLIGQHFSDPKYFWSRPSATAPQPNNGAASGASNLGPLNPALLQQVAANVDALHTQARTLVPVDLVTASASGLDPDISLAAAEFQAARVAAARRMTQPSVHALIERLQKGPWLGIIGESQVNVLELNMALDRSGP